MEHRFCLEKQETGIILVGQKAQLQLARLVLSGYFNSNVICKARFDSMIP